MMKRINKTISCLVVTLIIVIMVVSFCACEDKSLAGRKYYLEGSNQIYIEFLDDEYLQFHGVDFSFVDIEEFWGTTGLLDDLENRNFDVDACMQGRKKYIHWEDNDITVEVIEGSGLALGMQFDGKNTISFNELKYVLK